MGSKEPSHKGMVDTSPKAVTRRVARAAVKVRMSPKTFTHFKGKGSPKGNVLETARIAGILAAKKTPFLIPLCHPLELNRVGITFQVDPQEHTLAIHSEVICQGRTGVEMEALTAVSVAALTVYDMMKGIDPGIVITDLCLEYKKGGKSGEFKRRAQL